MYKRILVPLDGSELAERVIPYAVSIANALSSQVSLLRIVDSVPEQWADPTHGRYLDQLTSSFRNQAMDYLEGIAAPLRREGITVTCSAHEGNPSELIINESSREAETLIALSTHGRSGINRWVMGSVTDKVLHGVSAPLLILRSQEGNPPASLEANNIILPLDGSALSEQVLPHVVSLAKALGASVTLLRTTDISYYTPMGEDYPASMYDDLIQEATVEAEEYLKHMSQQLSNEGVGESQSYVRQGEAAGTILDMADDSPSTLIAMCTHGRSGVGRWVLGSVTDRVVRHSNRPVLVVRARE